MESDAPKSKTDDDQEQEGVPVERWFTAVPFDAAVYLDREPPRYAEPAAEDPIDDGAAEGRGPGD